MASSPDEMPHVVELIRDGPGSGSDEFGAARDSQKISPLTAIVLALAVVALVLWLFNNGSESTLPDDATPGSVDGETEPGGEIGSAGSDPLATLLLAESLPDQLLAAELYAAAPGPDSLRSLLDSIGGVEALIVGTAEGSFDLVTFNPDNHDELVASQRSSYGVAENQDFNQRWLVDGSDLVQTPLAPEIVHDVAHFNQDGSLAIWTNPQATSRFGPRTVQLGIEGSTLESDPVYASRSIIVDETLFALTSSSDYYSTSRRFETLIADRGQGQVVLDSGSGWAWIDSPSSGVIVAYPASSEDTTRVWSTTSLETLDGHRLAGLNYQRVAVSGDGSTTVGIAFDGSLEARRSDDLLADVVSFGSVDPRGIAQPLTLNRQGTLAITVDWNGTVNLWWIGHAKPIATIEGSAGPSRVLSEIRAPRSSSAVASDGARVAIQERATANMPTTWLVIDTDIERWIERACASTERRLSEDERQRLGLVSAPCGSDG